MKVSLNIVKKLVDFNLPSVDELVNKINEQLGGVEEVVSLGERYEKAVIVRVVGAIKHENADKLTVCKIDDGGIIQDVERDEGGYVQVVCGAPNVREGMFAVWLPPKSVVPASWDNIEQFVLDTRAIRGIKSNGMLAAGDELAINGDHNGIVDITEADMPEGKVLQAGDSFAAVFELDDAIIDIENKMFTHRPDCFGQLGVAREIAGIHHRQFISPEWYMKLPEFVEADGLDLRVENQTPQKVPRFMAVAIKDVDIKPSPLWLQCELVRLGSKAINNVVDVTNYVMLLTGQPLHAYDYDKIRGHTIGARMGQKSEKLLLLNGKTYEVTADDIVIFDGEGPIGMGGIMGGGNSEVGSETKNIVLECATFDMYAIRKTSMRHGLFTDAVTRFNKGQSPLQNDRVLAYAMKLVGGKQASCVFDERGHFDDCANSNFVYKADTIGMTTEFINERLGLKLVDEDVKDLLENVEVNVGDDASVLEIAAPFWRTDIELPEDIVEEVGRLYGFDKLPRELPLHTTKAVPKNSLREIKKRIRQSLSRAGANEVLTYSFVHEQVMRKAEQDVSQAFQLSNALSPDLQYYRLSVLPSLLDKIHANIKMGHDEFVLFELGKGHNKKYDVDDDEGLPRELEFVDGIYTSKKDQAGASYYHIQRLVTMLANDLGLSVVFTTINEPMNYHPVTSPFDQNRSAMIHTREGNFIGMIGELKQVVIKNFKLPTYTAAMTLDVSGIQKATEASQHNYVPLSRFPSVAQDISLKVGVDTEYQAIFDCVNEAVQHALTADMRSTISPLSIYQAEDNTAYKTVTLRVKVTSDAATLTDETVSAILTRASEAAKERFAAITV